MDRRVLFATLVLALAVVLGAGTVFFAFVEPPDTTRQPTVEWESASVGTVTEGASLATVAVENGSRVAVPTAGEDCGVRVLDGDGDGAWAWNASDCSAGSGAGSGTAPHPVAAGTLGGDPVVAVVDDDAVRVFHAVSGDERFVYELSAPATVAPTFGDVAGANQSSLVAVSSAGTVHVVGADGEAVWRADTGEAPLAPVTGNLTGDAAAEVVVGTTGEDPTLTAFGEGGEERWSRSLDVVPADLSAPRTTVGPTVVLADDAGSVHRLSPADGEAVWSVPLQDDPLTVGGVGSGHVRVAGGGNVWAVGLIDGSIVWKQQFGGNGDALRPLTPDATTETVVATRGGEISAIDGNGKVVSSGNVDATVVDNVVMADRGGLPTVLLLTEDGRVIAVTP
ncbi:outer membrane protein assembly factor BamB family protein [Haloparvum sp. AD34]